MQIKLMTANLDHAQVTPEEFGKSNRQFSICLIVPWISEHRAVVKNISRGFEQLSIQYLKAHLDRYGIRSDLINAQLLELTNDQIVECVTRGQYDLIGISCPAQRLYQAAKDIVKRLAGLPDAPHITMGGWFATVAHEEIMHDCPGLNSVVRGEGEFAIIDLLSHIEGDDFQSILGLTWRAANGDVITNPVRPRINDLDNLPFPDRSDLPEIFKIFPKNEYYAHLMASRGCYANCSFCSINSLFDVKGRTMRSPENIVTEIEELYTKYGISNFQFIDEIFLDRSRRSTRWALEICDEIEKRRLKISFFIYCRSTDITEDVFRRLKEVGLYMVYVGVESGSQAGLDRFNKATTVEDNSAGIKILKKLGIRPQIGFIMIDPAASFDELKQNYQWLADNEAYVQNNFVNKLNLYFKTPIVEDYSRRGIVPEPTLDERHRYVFLDRRVEGYSIAVDRISNALFPIEERLFELKRRYRKLAVQGNDNSSTERRTMLEAISKMSPLMNEIWREVAGKIIATLDDQSDNGPETVMVERVLEDYRALSDQYTELLDRIVDGKGETFELDSIQPKLANRRVSHYINDCLPS